MSYYLPQPPRAWSRVQNSCSLITGTENIYNTSYIVFDEKLAMLNKGNVLQYKANSGNLTKAQRYSKIATGQWVNRNTTWATQSTRGYTNPNTTSLKRSGNINIAIDPITGAIIGPTLEPPTCPQIIVPINEGLPSNGGGGSDINDPDIPPPVPPSSGSNVFPPIVPITPIEPIVIQDGGTLICSVQENICTGETKASLSQQLCHPTTASDVPGPIQELCWNDGTQTWYPRQRYIMTNSTNKWPVNAELAGAIQITAPYLVSVTAVDNVITLSWTFNEGCIPASNFNIFQDEILIQVVPGTTLTTTITVSNCNYYQYYIVAENITAKVVSEKSNIVGINIAYIENPPASLNVTNLGSTTATLTWLQQDTSCAFFNIYLDTILVASNISTLDYTFAALTPNTFYLFGVQSTITINGVTDSSEIVYTSATTLA